MVATLHFHEAKVAVSRAWYDQALEVERRHCWRLGERRIECADLVYFPGVQPGWVRDVVELRKQGIIVSLEISRS